jgi:hypothetical protein
VPRVFNSLNRAPRIGAQIIGTAVAMNAGCRELLADFTLNDDSTYAVPSIFYDGINLFFAGVITGGLTSPA